MKKSTSNQQSTFVRARPDAGFHKFIQIITSNNYFSGVIMFVIFLNAVLIAIETSSSLKEEYPLIFFITDNFFFSVYLLEFLLKLYAEPINYWKNPYNLFDLFVLVLLVVQVTLDAVTHTDSGFSALKVLRALRALRALRTISFIRSLQVLVSAMVSTFRTAVIDLILLLLLIMFLFAITGYYFFGYDETGDKENWGTFGRAMLSLFILVTVDGWTTLQESLDKLSPATRIFTMIFIFIGHFIFTNLFIGVIISNIHAATCEFNEAQMKERIAILEKKKSYLKNRQHKELKRVAEKQRDGQFTNFADMTKSFQETLRHDDITTISDLSVNVQWMETFLMSLDHQEKAMHRRLAHAIQQLHDSLQATTSSSCMDVWATSSIEEVVLHMIVLHLTSRFYSSEMTAL
ncbi:cation channel sperm-associated protein 3-like [Corticium candelabrum]|uniref:cation channel sperm-associated protein 3-like n=1 Tax=Corticium candelabrum TaxID=121492 RepID=UPI002E2678F9|nr:cation channel sperm-associated protein 3-like [Corticium candelabrum]